MAEMMIDLPGRPKKRVRFTASQPPTTELPPPPTTSAAPSIVMPNRKHAYDFFRPLVDCATMKVDEPSFSNSLPSNTLPVRHSFNFFKHLPKSSSTLADNPSIGAQIVPSSSIFIPAGVPPSVPRSIQPTSVSPAGSPVFSTASPSTAPTTTTAVPPTKKYKKHAADYFLHLPVPRPAAEHVTTSNAASPLQPYVFSPPSTPSHALPSPFPTFSASPNTFQPTSVSQLPLNRPLRRRKTSKPTRQNVIDIMTDTPLPQPEPSFQRFVFNTDDFLATRQVNRSWRGSYKHSDLILSREELHAEHVNLDRELPQEMEDSFYPSFAISPRDLQSLHGYIMSRYDVRDYDDYLHLLALYRNTRAIEAQKGRIRFTELNDAAAAVSKVRLSLINALQARHSVP